MVATGPFNNEPFKSKSSGWFPDLGGECSGYDLGFAGLRNLRADPPLGT